MNKDSDKLKWFILIVVVLITFICFIPSLNNQFTTWDDDSYITQNPYITSFSTPNIKALCTKEFVGNWQPLTMLTYAWNYSTSKLNPGAYFLTNLILHLLNVCLVFLLALSLLENMVKKGYAGIKGNYLFAGLCALWFGIHPMHVESIAWASERKDVLYTFFYLVSLLFYMRYIKEKKLKWMLYVFVFFFLSCLSKPMAVVLPLSLLAIDILLKRKIEVKLFTEKLPLFMLSLIMGGLAFYEQQHGGAVTSFQALTFGERIMFPAYGFIMYCLKFVLPINLSSYYPYPDLTGPPLPAIFFIAPFIAIALISIPLYIAYKKGNNNFRLTVFGIGFYLANLVFVLQFISVGKTIMADRYSYVSYFGLFFTLLYLAFTLIEKRNAFSMPIQIALLGVTLLFSITCYARTKVWHSTETLWRDVATKYPMKVGEAYESLGNYYAATGNLDSAYTNYKVLSTIYFRDPYVFDRLGNICLQKQDFEQALISFNKSLAIDSNYYFSIVDRANVYARMTKFTLALADYSHACRINPTDEKVLLKKGTVEMNMGDIKAALIDFNKTLTIDPNNLTCMYVISIAYKKSMDYTSALAYAIKAKNAGYNVPDEYIKGLTEALPSTTNTVH
jgi:tetratricopeptide (TPR) repeat protein